MDVVLYIGLAGLCVFGLWVVLGFPDPTDLIAALLPGSGGNALPAARDQPSALGLVLDERSAAPGRQPAATPARRKASGPRIVDLTDRIDTTRAHPGRIRRWWSGG